MREQNASSVREPSVRGFRSQTRKHSSSPDNPFVELSLRFVDRSIRRKRSVEPSQILPLQVERDNRDSRFPFTIHEGIHNWILRFPENSIVDKGNNNSRIFTSTIFITFVSLENGSSPNVYVRRSQLIDWIEYRGETNIDVNKFAYGLSRKDTRGIRRTTESNRVSKNPMSYALSVIFEKLLSARRYLRNTNTVTKINICYFFLFPKRQSWSPWLATLGDTFFSPLYNYSIPKVL